MTDIPNPVIERARAWQPRNPYLAEPKRLIDELCDELEKALARLAGNASVNRVDVGRAVMALFKAFVRGVQSLPGSGWSDDNVSHAVEMFEREVRAAIKALRGE